MFLMKKIVRVVLIACSLLSWNQSFGIENEEMILVGDNNSFSLTTIISKGLPVIYVETVDNEEPTCDYVSAPAGCMGASITNATKVPGRLIIYKNIDGADSVLYDSGDYEKDVSGMTIKLRGNTSAYQDKKPYKIKLQKKSDLLFRDDNNYKDKEWLLLKDDYLTTITGLHVNEMVGMVWTPRHHFVNLIINKRYRGTYLLCEAVKRNPDCRLNVDKNCGYIFEYDPYWWNEDVYVSSSSSPSYNYTFKYPDSDDILPEQLDYMQSLVTRFENSVRNATYSSMIDVASFARWCLVHDIMGTRDAGGTNLYYTKYDTTATTPIVMPLAWDFDMAERTESAWSASHVEHMTKFFNSSNRSFVAEFVYAWHRVRDSLVSDMASYLRGFNNSEEGRGLEASAELNKMVYGNLINIANSVGWRNYWISNRYSWLNPRIMAMNPLGDVNVNGIVDVSDVTALIDMILNGAEYEPWSADVNDDGVLNVSDVTALIQQILNS